ncbi:MAG: DUF4185 domain-containing protein, partial [Armatimonadetes bacterium]|nr:DUF4185 domain-containing protein [Armatimonadota bacterium]
PAGPVIESITWHWDTHTRAAPGSDLWPVTWGPDDNLYTAWGDGGGFGGTNSDGRVAMGFARIEGPPEAFVGVNVNGGKNPEHPTSFPGKKGKTGGIISVGGTLYAFVNLQDGHWPAVNQTLAWSEDLGATWTRADWVFPSGAGSLKFTRFLNFGRDYAGVPEHLAGYVYFYGTKEPAPGEVVCDMYLGRAPVDRLEDRMSYEFLSGLTPAGEPVWSPDISTAQPIFTDPNGTGPGTVVYNPGIGRYIMTAFHGGPGQLGIFDAPQPWGPWTTVAYYQSWGDMGSEGEGLTCSFPQKWMSPDGLTMWCVFAVWGDGAKVGVKAHDCFNLVKTTLTLRR